MKNAKPPVHRPEAGVPGRLRRFLLQHLLGIHNVNCEGAGCPVESERGL